MASSGSPDSSAFERTDFWERPAQRFEQAELEAAYIRGGVARAEAAFATASARHRAGDTSPGMHLLASYVHLLAKAVRDAVAPNAKGQHMATVALLRAMEPDAVALLAVRRVVNHMLAPDWQRNSSFRSVAYSVGAAVHEELCTQQMQDAAPGLYYAITRDLGRQGRRGDVNTVRYTRKAARKGSLPVAEWAIEHRHIIGVWLVDQLVAMGMLLKHRKPEWKRALKHVDVLFLSKRCMDHVEEFQSSLKYAAPAFGPAVVPPLPYRQGSIGGWYTPDMQRRHPTLVRGHPASRREQDSPVVLSAVNRLQATRWRVNSRVLKTLQEARRAHAGASLWGGVIEDLLAPSEAVGAAAMREYAAWFKAKRRIASKRKRVAHAMAMAKAYAPYEELYFVWFLDTRGRMYPFASGISPQGADMERGLLELVTGAKMTPCNERWFWLEGAGLWGHGRDKAPLDERIRWCKGETNTWAAIARDPVADTRWMEAEKPVQFLAWVLDLGAWLKDREHLIRVPITSDATCSGLQHLAALSRDENLAYHVNVLPSDKRQDAYLFVQRGVMEELARTPGDSANRLLMHGVPRSWVKPGVMNYSYGVTQRRYSQVVAEDYMDTEARHVFTEQVQMQDAALLGKLVWASLGHMLAGAANVKAWLQDAARRGSASATLEWITPSGFRAAQSYYAPAEKRVRTAVLGMRQVRILFESDAPAPRDAIRAFPANYVHSMDASHAHLTAAAMPEDAPLVMVHDSFGTNLEYAETLSKVLRQQFALMYAESPLLKLTSKGPPPQGELQPAAVIDSPYFFS